MCPFWKKKKKKYTALKVVAIVFTALAAVAGAYVIFEKFFKDKLLKKLGKGNCEECVEAGEETDASADESADESADASDEAVEADVEETASEEA